MQLWYYTEGPGKDEGIQEGDVLVSNNPQQAGGSHLPDITVITPVFNQGKIVFFVASRGHHQVLPLLAALMHRACPCACLLVWSLLPDLGEIRARVHACNSQSEFTLPLI